MSLALFCILAWATSFVGIGFALRNFDPFALSFVRFFFAAVCGVAWLFWKQKPLPSKSDLAKLAYCGLVGIAVYSVCLNVAQTSLSAGLTSFITGIFPLVTLVLSVIFLKEETGKFLLIGMLISLVGVFIISLARGLGVYDWYVWLVVCSAIAGASTSIVQRTMMPRVDAMTQSCWSIIFGALFLSFFSIEGVAQFAKAPLLHQLNAIYLGVVPAFAAYGAYTLYMDKVGAARASTIMYAVPFLASLLGYFVLDQTLTMMAFIGGIIATIGVIIARMKSKA